MDSNEDETWWQSVNGSSVNQPNDEYHISVSISLENIFYLLLCMAECVLSLLNFDGICVSPYFYHRTGECQHWTKPGGRIPLHTSNNQV